ncbi:MAG TPA: chromosome segregation protein SMC [Bacillales bacterium]|nr:chromosome segregation protein SMC [Bacillales bacterium]
MLLKQLDLVGFKSFAHRVNIEFVPGVTAVVGPNGSGKSNISDAVRWVLGEQSAKSLRGGKMEDIIFGGSDAKKPLNVAEVTLTLDNEDHYLPLDYNEISVTRRVYRSGDSEYLMNKQPCRLKDIVDLFMDSGLGREAYSVIGQGKIDEILNSKSEEKRKIFEEAAGVLKYKTRKQKAEKKLADTQDNLARVDDILHELGNQVEPLKLQASVAKDYLQKKQELEETEVALIVHEIEDRHRRWEEVSASVKSLETEDIAMSAEIQSEDAEVEKQRSEMKTLDEVIEQLQEALLTDSEELEKLEGQKEVLKERRKNATQNRALLKQRIDDAKERLEKKDREIAAKKEEFAEAEERLREIKDSLRKEAEQFDAHEADAESELERLKSEYIEVLNERAGKRNEMRYLEEQREQLLKKSRRLDDDHEKYIAMREAIRERKRLLLAELEEQRAELERSRIEYVKTKEQLEADRGKLVEAENEWKRAQREWQQKKSRKEMLEAMQDDYSGFFHGVKEVLKAKRRLEGIEGAVAELIQVERAYETAVETALGGAMQHVVVESEKHAREAIAHLKRSGRGRATFLPMSVIRPRQLTAADRQAVAAHEAFVAAASELVVHDERYQTVVDHLLGNIVVAKDLRGANELARLLRHRVRVVTLDGDVVNPGGSMSGGSRKAQNHSLLGRQRELEQTVKALRRAEKESLRFEQTYESLRRKVEEASGRLETLREQGEALRLEEQKKDGERREIEVEAKNADDRLTLYDREKASYDEEMAEIADRLGKLEAEAEQLGGREKQLEGEIETVTEVLQRQQSSKEDAQSAMTELKIQAAEQEQRVGYLRNAIAQHESEREETDRLRQQTEEEYWQLEGEMSDHSSGEEQLDERIERQRSKKDATMEEISGKRQRRVELQLAIEDKERELKERKRAQKRLSEQLRGQEVKQNRLDVELDHLLNTLREEYELSFEAARERYAVPEDPEQARKQVKLIKRAIDELGTVNLGAIEEYERVSERYAFLKEQQDDLLAAKQNLLTVISEMDEEMVKRFEHTFSQVQEQFRLVFRELFGGGRADLRLSDPDDLLNTGVEVMAQPPGKKLQHLALLSGGERALTAITLLFAILKVRPVPFCVLDEVEAALDDANVDRFAHYLKTFSKHTQFVVITHRRGTMEEADVLYGVTMQESGISNLVSVRLEETKQLVES